MLQNESRNEWKCACSLWCRLFLKPKEHTASCNSTICIGVARRPIVHTCGPVHAAAPAFPFVLHLYIVELHDTVCSFCLRNNLHHRLHVRFHSLRDSFCSIISISLGAVSICLSASLAINDFRLSKKASHPYNLC